MSVQASTTVADKIAAMEGRPLIQVVPDALARLAARSAAAADAFRAAAEVSGPEPLSPPPTRKPPVAPPRRTSMVASVAPSLPPRPPLMNVQRAIEAQMEKMRRADRTNSEAITLTELTVTPHESFSKLELCEAMIRERASGVETAYPALDAFAQERVLRQPVENL